ncbi:20701_t:CDS:2, partial [Racocetra persica]
IKVFCSIKSGPSMESQIGYKNIIQCFGISIGTEPNPEFYLVLEFAELGDLRGYLNTINLNWKAKVNIARQTASGLRFLHENNILHRDLHTRNVVIKPDTNGIRILITDFGASKSLNYNSTSIDESVSSEDDIQPDQEFCEESNYNDSKFEKQFSEIAMNRPEFIAGLVNRFPGVIQAMKEPEKT